MKRGSYKYIEDMRAALWEAYKEVYRGCWTQWDAWTRTAKHPAPRFYVSPKQAYEVLRPMFRGDDSHLLNMTPEKQRMYRILYDEANKIAQKPRFVGKSLWYIMPYVVSQPAPEFFIGPECVRKTFRHIKQGKYAINTDLL